MRNKWEASYFGQWVRNSRRRSGIRARIVAALRADVRTKSAVIDVVVDGRVLILVGTVACEEIRRAAEEIVLQLEESVTLSNELKVGKHEGENR